MQYVSFILNGKFQIVSRTDEIEDFDPNKLDELKSNVAKAFFDGANSRKDDWAEIGIDFSIISVEAESAKIVEL